MRIIQITPLIYIIHQLLELLKYLIHIIWVLILLEIQTKVLSYYANYWSLDPKEYFTRL